MGQKPSHPARVRSSTVDVTSLLSKPVHPDLPPPDLYPSPDRLRADGLKGIGADLAASAPGLPPAVAETRINAKIEHKKEWVLTLPTQTPEEIAKVKAYLKSKKTVKAVRARGPTVTQIRSSSPSLISRKVDPSVLGKYPDLPSVLMGRKVRIQELFSAGWAGGARKRCQDSLIVDYVVAENGRVFLLCGVFDGHGESGEVFSEFVASDVSLRLSFVLKSEPVIGIAVEKAMKLMQSEILRDSKSLFGGTTVTLAILVDDFMWTAHLGDSLAYALYSDKALRLTSPHKWEDEKEKLRAEAISTAQVRQTEIRPGVPVGPMRIFRKGEEFPGLAMSRSLGDAVAHTLGVSASPDVLEYPHKWSDEKAIVMLASDGIWDVLDPTEVLEIYKTSGNVENVCREATRRWVYKHMGIVDDISIVAICLNSLTLGGVKGDEKKDDEPISTTPKKVFSASSSPLPESGSEKTPTTTSPAIPEAKESERAKNDLGVGLVSKLDAPVPDSSAPAAETSAPSADNPDASTS